MIVAGSDFGFERNSSALALAEPEGLRVRILKLREWRPMREALRPSQVFAEMALEACAVRCQVIMGDAHYRAAAREAFEPYSVTLRDAPASIHAWEVMAELRRFLVEDLLDLRSFVGDVDRERLAKQFAAVRATDGRAGALKIIIGQAKDGSHADVVAAIALAVWQLRHMRQTARVASGRVVR